MSDFWNCLFLFDTRLHLISETENRFTKLVWRWELARCHTLHLYKSSHFHIQIMMLANNDLTNIVQHFVNHCLAVSEEFNALILLQMINSIQNATLIMFHKSTKLWKQKWIDRILHRDSTSVWLEPKDSLNRKLPKLSWLRCLN